MKYRFMSALILSFVLIAGCQQSKSTDGSEALKNVLINYFDGIKNKDFKKMAEATVEYKFDNFKISVDNMSGHMSYSNNGIFVFNDTTKQSFNWIESAAFRKSKEEWKMNFLHITERYGAKK